MTALAHVQTGHGPRALVLLHGFLGSSRNLTTLACMLCERDPSLSVFALDLTGHGAAPPLPPGAGLDTLARDALATARGLGLGAPLRVAGHSLGGRVALAAGRLEAAALAHVALLDISPARRAEDGEATRVVAALASAPTAADDREPFRTHFRDAGLTRDLAEWLLLNLTREGTRYRWRIERAALAALHPRIGADDLWPAVEEPRAYSLHCIRGARSRHVTDADARRLEAAGCPVDTVEGAGHFLHVEQPANVAERIIQGMRGR